MMVLIHLALAVFFAVFAQSLVMTKHKRVTALDGYLPTSGYLAEISWSRSLADCAYKCLQTSGSRALFHVQKSGICQCHHTLYYGHSISFSNLTAVDGAKYCESKGWNLECPNVNHTFETVELPDGTTFQYRIFVDTSRTFNESVAKCASEGSRLLQVMTPEKFEFTVQLAACSWAATPGSVFWIDAVYTGNSTNFTRAGWETMAGDPLPQNPDYWYEQYHPFMFNHWNTHRESLCLLSAGSLGNYGAGWYFIRCDRKYWTICEKD